ncbi:acyl-ACP desaturase [Streptomyces hainanensis]|uniref:Acyl-ACP desaturase n=1 Tax=Streptomyces hainanensis TaxID=402648 RepID=A0A4R4TGL5_9ACTN|nr:acyl-ACP desaturase [Streptomyces hainanensis]TDC74362.1 acyl-ACP desaturase [Streptomyces hainanensis]
MDRRPGSREDVRLLSDLEPVVAKALDAHLRNAEDWYPHEYVPWSEGANFDGVLGGLAWEPGQQRLSDAARDGLLHNLLSEDNLPSYHRVIAELFSLDGAWGTWVHRWTVEEGRHGMAIRDYLLVTRSADPVALERDRSAHVQNGYEIDYRGDVLASLVYVTLQELGTRISYRNIRRLCDEPTCAAMLRRIARDENHHMLFYRTVLAAAMERDPDRTVRALADVVDTIRRPGHGAPGFGGLARSMARSGIYTPVTHHDEVLLPVVRFLRVFEATGLGPDGEQARNRLSRLLDHSARQALRFAHLQERIARLPAGTAARP